ncbi:MAG TPA: SpoIID/LytB domain-containing protein, partial [Motilibacteraceae bacterium]|nr:SpoIID/LytB domain-containing protein [Motilibacteraceae bacterium]
MPASSACPRTPAHASGAGRPAGVGGAVPRPRHRRARTLARLVLAAALGVGGSAVLQAPAQAAESYPVPAGGSVTLAGHGFGHGHGLSQWGAYGAAEKGLSWQQILAFYYPGTRISAPTLPDATLRILMSADDTTDTRVDPAAGLTLTAASGTVTLPTGPDYAGWRLVTAPQDRTQLQLQHLTGGGAWTVWNPGTGADDPAAVVGGDAAFAVTGAGATTSVDALPRLVLPSGTRRAVRGAIRSVAWSGGGTRTIALVPMEQYLRSVVPAEMPASWPPAALAAQSVAARTYAGRARAVAGSTPYDVCDSTACQVYAGSADYTAGGTRTALREHSASDAAVRATAGQVVRYGSGTSDAATLAFTQFSASNGGWTTAGSQPYLVAKADPYDGVPSESWNPHDWSVALSGSRLAAAYPAAGSVSRLDVLSRDGHGDWGGRVTSVRVTGSSGSVTVSGSSFQAALGLRSTWWTVTSSGGGSTPPPAPAPGTGDFSGDGRPDLLARDAAGALWLYPGTADGSLGARTLVGRSGWSVMSALTGVGDLSGD